MANQPALTEAIRAVTRALVGVRRIKVEGDPLYGIKDHEQWYPKAVLVDTDLLIELSNVASCVEAQAITNREEC
jgi:hypothetical protein